MTYDQPTSDFVLVHRNDDVRALALQASRYPDVDMTMALQQIAGWQTAKTKLPAWAETEGLIFPPHLSMEQCSSEQTALYKASIAGKATTMVDLTGGFGVDFSYMARNCDKAIYVEMQPHLCEIASHNMRLLGLNHVETICADGVDYLQEMPHVSLIYLDPARRDSHGARTFGIADCTPDVLQLQNKLLQKADHVLIKLSPMLDWHETVRLLKHVCEVHIVSTRNECKEILVLMDGEKDGAAMIRCVNDDMVFTFQADEEASAPIPAMADGGENYLYEPNASIMKAGCFNLLAEKMQCRKVSPNSHLFVSEGPIERFPGRSFRIVGTTTMNKQELRKALSGISHANIATRNFPLSPDELRKKLKLKDGGSIYIFASTDNNGKRMIYICEKIQTIIK